MHKYILTNHSFWYIVAWSNNQCLLEQIKVHTFTDSGDLMFKQYNLGNDLYDCEFVDMYGKNMVLKYSINKIPPWKYIHLL
jgi:hypothetical protein